ncbi:hypothetical protein CORC01_01309 [Colletotrichum orchidophilum]|uniref:Uncharacterized protein n=1 Tax=Colletotrichum orchidophilum TaxID=1209926 RepID=A0A1G4BPQ0_9PEZI|nr:uncharacterized protein CORC01_01309 [Colletotrichum orchidophilum]OHF03256.1 hypothetical protein CORC01_01309 [Colletotrichum orchidophilum]
MSSGSWGEQGVKRGRAKVTGTRVPARRTGRRQSVEFDQVDHGGSDRGTVSSGSIRTAARSRGAYFVARVRQRQAGPSVHVIELRRRQAKDGAPVHFGRDETTRSWRMVMPWWCAPASESMVQRDDGMDTVVAMPRWRIRRQWERHGGRQGGVKQFGSPRLSIATDKMSPPPVYE